MTQKAYVVANNIAEAREIGALLMSLGYTYQGFNSAASCIASLSDKRLQKPSIMVVHENLHDLGGLELIKLCQMGELNIPSVVLVENERFERALNITHVPHLSFVVLPLSEQRLKWAFDQLEIQYHLEDEVKRLKCKVNESVEFPNFIGNSKPILATKELLSRYAPSHMSVLIQGESGVGKEVVARSLHQLSPRHSKPYITINCGAIPEHLIESELFGHVKGAFTGAMESREGKFVAASGGTLFLDEIAELPLQMQVKLLRVLQEGEITPVGSNEIVPVDVRVVAATNVDLASAVAEGKFREDLFYRLNVLPLNIAPLRARGADVILLAQHFLECYALKNQLEKIKLGESAKQLFLSLPWPGNVRQLENAVYRAAILSEGNTLTKTDFHFLESEHVVPNVPISNSQWPTLEEMEQHYVLKVVAMCHGNLSEAARILGISRSTLYRKLPNNEAIPNESVGS